MTTERKYFSGNSLEIALMQAARHHGLQPEEVAYRKIDKRHGFLRSRKSVVIEVDPESPQKETEPLRVVEEPPVVEQPPAVEESPSPTESQPSIGIQASTKAFEETTAEAPEDDREIDAVSVEAGVEAGGPELREASEEVDLDAEEARDREAASRVEPIEDLIEAARQGLDEIKGFAKLEIEVDISEGEGQLEIELTGPDRDRLIEDRGNLLLAIQHLLPRLIRGYAGRSIPCHVDSEDFHAGREVELRQQAEEAAQEVIDRQKPRTLPPMNPAERRIIHVALADRTEVSTESQGKGFFKRVTIRPAMRRPRGFDRY